jgi:cell division protein FtsL
MSDIAIPLPHRIAMRNTGVLSTLVSAAVLLVLISLLLLVETGSVTTWGYEVQRLEREKQLWQQRNSQLEAEIAALRSLERVEAEARSRLGMREAETVLFLELGAPPPRPVAQTPGPAVPTAEIRGVWERLVERVWGLIP